MSLACTVLLILSFALNIILIKENEKLKQK
jgi:hypothetical protein